MIKNVIPVFYVLVLFLLASESDAKTAKFDPTLWASTPYVNHAVICVIKGWEIDEVVNSDDDLRYIDENREELVYRLGDDAVNMIRNEKFYITKLKCNVKKVLKGSLKVDEDIVVDYHVSEARGLLDISKDQYEYLMGKRALFLLRESIFTFGLLSGNIYGSGCTILDDMKKEEHVENWYKKSLDVHLIVMNNLMKNFNDLGDNGKLYLLEYGPYNLTRDRNFAGDKVTWQSWWRSERGKFREPDDRLKELADRKVLQQLMLKR